METTIERLEQIRAHFNLTQKQMGKLMGVSQPQYSSILDGRSTVTLAQLEMLMDAHGINPVWVISGEQDMFLSTDGPVDWSREPTEEAIKTLYRYVCANADVAGLSQHQHNMLRLACADVLYENPEIKSLGTLAIGVRVYLLYIRAYPMLGMPDVGPEPVGAG